MGVRRYLVLNATETKRSQEMGATGERREVACWMCRIPDPEKHEQRKEKSVALVKHALL